MLNILKERAAIECLRAFEPQDEPYYLCYSGGKDSDTIRILAELAGVRHTIENNHTTVDAPETVRYIRSIPNVHINYPKKTMWQLIVEKRMPPTRINRYCCAELKESGGKGRLRITGVRWDESRNRRVNNDVITIKDKTKRIRKTASELEADVHETQKGGLVMNMDNDKNRRFVEHCYRTSNVMINPIIDWTDDDVWDFLRYYGCESNPLYRCGYNRIGCIGCPMAGEHRIVEFNNYPKYKNLYTMAFDRMVKKNNDDLIQNRMNWKNGDDVMKWWLGEDPLQLSMFEEG